MIGLLTVAASPSRAVVHHFVFGLDTNVSYDVIAGDTTILREVVPGPAGDLTFTAGISSPIRIIPSSNQDNAGLPEPAHAPFSVVGPMPNPSSGIVSLNIDADRREDAKVTLIEAGTGRVRDASNLALVAGTTPVRFALDRRLPSGIYIVRVETKEGAVARKLALLRGGSPSAAR